MKSALKWVLHRAPLLILIAAWEILSLLIPKVPSFSVIVMLAVERLAEPAFLSALAGSLRRMAIGYTGVCLFGIGAGLFLGRFRWLNDLMGTLVASLNAMPGATWVPLAIILFGLNETAVIFTVLLGATGIVMANTSFGIRDVPPVILRAGQTLEAKGTKLFWHVVVPSAIPRIIDGLRLAWAFGWRALMAGELLIGSINGIGKMLNEVTKTKQLNQLLAFMLIILLIGLIVDSLIFNRLIGNRVRARWGAAS